MSKTFLSSVHNGNTGGKRTRGGLGRVALQLGTAITVVCVLLFAVRVVLAAPIYAGPISVTANMGNFSPTAVRVANSATSSLSAYYLPPSGMPEGQLSASYDWSVSSVQYKALQADSFGSPPANSYSDSISPAQPSANSGATLTFTPEIAGYWQVSTSCSVTVTDTTTNQYWGGSANAGPEDLTSVTLTINPTNDSSVFLNTKDFVVVSVAPADLAPDTTLSITGGGTFANGVTTETMTSASEDVYYYGANIYGSGGSAGSGQISATVNPPAQQASAANARKASPMSAASGGASPGATLKVSVSLDFEKLSDVGQQAVVSFTNSLVQSGTSALMAQLEYQINNSLDYYKQNGTYQQQADAQQEYYDLNSEGGYNTIQNNLTTALNFFQTGAQGSTPPASADAGLVPSNTPIMPGFPGTAISSVTLTPTFTAGVILPILGSNWTMPALKTGNFFESVAETASANFHFGDLATGTVSISGKLSFQEGFNNQLTSTPSIPIEINFTTGIPILAGYHFQIEYTPSFGITSNNLSHVPFSQTVTINLVSSN